MFVLFFTFNMNVPECTPQSVGNIFGLDKKDCLYIYWLVVFRIEKNPSNALRNVGSFRSRFIFGWNLTGKDRARRSGHRRMDKFYTAAASQRKSS